MGILDRAVSRGGGFAVEGVEAGPAIFFEAFLSFIGLGLQAPLASLGVLIEDGYKSMRYFSYKLIYPAIIISTIMICFNLLGDGLRDALDPKMRK